MEQPPALAPIQRRARIIAAQVAFVATLGGVTLWLLLRPSDDLLIRRADAWMDAGRYHYAATAYSDALNRNPANRNARLGLARADYALRQYADAISLSEPLLRETDPAWHAATLTLIGQAADALGQDGTIYLQAAAALNIPPIMYRISNRRLAEARWAQQDYPRAIAAYQRSSTTVGGTDAYPATASQPAWDFVPFDTTSDRQRAVYYATLLQASVNLSDTIATMKTLTIPELKGRATSFITTLTKAPPSTVGEAAVRLTIVGTAYIALGECGLARATLDRAAQAMRPDRPFADLFAYRSVCRQRAGDRSGAEADLKQALKIDPNRGLAHLLYGQYYLDLPQPDLPQAQRELDAARAADSTNPLLYLDYYNLALAAGDYATAEQQLTVFAAFAQGKPAPDGLPPKARLANFYLDTGYNLCNGNGYKAAEDAGRSGDAAGLDAQGWAEHLCDRGAANAGLVPLTRAATLDPAGARIRYHLGAVYARMGETALARDQLMWAQDLDPDGEIARRALDLMARLPPEVGRLKIKD